MSNPVPFNPDTMTLRHAKDCVEALRHTFDQLDREDVGSAEIVHYLRQVRDQQLRRFGEPK